MELKRPKPTAKSFWPALLLASAVLIAGCSSPVSSPSTSVTAPTVPGSSQLDVNGTVTVGVRSLPTDFNPSTPAGDNRITQMVMEQVLPQPFMTGPGYSLQTSQLLDSAEVEGISPLTVVYVINPAAVWSDGAPISASDFVYLWHEELAGSAALAGSGLVAGYRDIATITGSHAGKTVTVVFKKPFSEWQWLFSNLVPASVGERYGWSSAFAGFSASRDLSGGPFEISSYSPGRSLVLSRNPRYWGTAAHVAHIRFVVEPSQAALMAGLKSGTLSVAVIDSSLVSPDDATAGLAGLSSNPTSLARQRGTVRASSGSLSWSGFAESEIWQLCLNSDDALTSQIDIRKAIEHSLDRSEIEDDSEALVDPAISGATSRFAVSGESSAGPVSHVPVGYEPRVASRLFALAGYSAGQGGLLRPAGLGSPLVLDLLEPSSNWAVDQAGLVIQASLRQLGVTVKITRRPLDEMLSTLLPKGRYQLALAPFEVSPAYAEMAPDYSSSVLPAPASSAAATSAGEPWSTPVPAGSEPGASESGTVTRDVVGIDDPTVDSDIALALSDLDPTTAFADMEKAETRLWGEAVTVPLFQPGLDLVHSTRIDNVSESPSWAGIMWDAEDWAILKTTAQPPTKS